jgi:hypothetical protein
MPPERIFAELTSLDEARGAVGLGPLRRRKPRDDYQMDRRPPFSDCRSQPQPIHGPPHIDIRDDKLEIVGLSSAPIAASASNVATTL